MFYENLFHVGNEAEQREIICNNLRLIPLDEMQTVFGLSPSLFSHFHRFRRAAESASFPPGEAKGGVRIRLGAFQMVFCILRLTPPALLRRPQLCMKQLYAVKDGYSC